MVMAKRKVLFYSVILVSLFIVGFASAEYTCSAGSNDIMYWKVNQTYNYHFGLASNTAYDEVCYSNFFTVPYYGANPQDCSGSNWLFNLSGNTDAHASYNKTPSAAVSAIYNVEACYGDLNCIIEDHSPDPTSTICSTPNYKLILKFNNNTPDEGYNLHGADWNYTGTGYPHFLCCNSSNPSSGSTNPNVQWRNSTGSIITKARVGDLVWANWTNKPLGTFSAVIYENDNGNPFYNPGFDDLIFYPVVYTIGNNLIVNWTIKLSDLTPTSDYNNFRTQFNKSAMPPSNQSTGDLAISWCNDTRIDSWAGETCDDGNLTNGDGCDSNCQIEGPIPSPLRWQNSSRDLITRARIGQTVTLNDSIGGLTTENFIIFEKDNFATENFTTGDDFIRNAGSGISNLDNNRITTWVIAIAEVLLSDPLGDYDHFVFNRSGKNSGNLSISWCGDGGIEIWAGETCDDGNSNDADACFNNCTINGDFCGDFVVNATSEECDEGDPDLGGYNGNYSHLIGGGQYCTLDCLLRDPNVLMWMDLNGNAIGRSQFGSTVMLFYTDGENSSESFDVWEYNFLWPDSYITEVIIWDTPTPNARGFWTIPSKSELDEEVYDFDNFQFEIDDRPRSEDLQILESNISTDISPPNLTLEAPECGININVTDTIDINFTVFDSDSLVSGNVKVNDEVIYTFSGPSGSYSVSHQFNEANTSKIRVYAENSNGEKASANSNIIVINRSYSQSFIAACIKEPKNFEYITTDYAKFDASTTRGIDYNSTFGTITELPIAGYKFIWQFSDGRDNPYADFWTNGSDNRTYIFYKYFDQYGENWAKMSAWFNRTY